MKKIAAKYIKILKDNLAVITLVPFLLGGMWQIISLSLISPSYIRFFSVSQQIADGLLITIDLTLIIIITLLTSYVCNFFYSLFKIKNKYKIRRVSYINKWIILLVAINCMLALSLQYFKPSEDSKHETTTTLAELVFMLASAVFSVSSIKITLYFIDILRLYKLHKDTNIYHNVQNFFSRFYLISGSMFASVIFISQLILLHKNFVIPTNLYNQKLFLGDYKKKFRPKDVNIIYFNDKYIFLESIDTSNINLVHVLPFNNLFSEPNVK